MGWDDRGWAPLEEPEWEVDDGSKAASAPSPRGAHVSVVLALVVALTAVAGVAAGQFPRGHPLVPAFELPHLFDGADASSASEEPAGGLGRIVPLGGPSVATAPSRYTLRGRTAATDGVHSTGPVVLRGRWDNGSWLVLDRTQTDGAGNFEVTSKLRRRGVLELRLTLPDGFVGRKTIRVD